MSTEPHTATQATMGMPIVALVNPVAGSGDAVDRWDKVALDLTERGRTIETIATKSASHATGVAARAAADGACVVAVGGDGLVRDVAAGVVRSGGTMAIVPSGRGNDLAGVLKLPTRPAYLADMLQNGRTRVVDVLDVDGHVVPGNVYVGVDSVAARMINANRRLPSLLLYRGAGLVAAMRWRRTLFSLTYVPAGAEPDSPPVVRNVYAHDIVVANSGRYGHGLEIVPGARLDDGIIDVLIVAHGSPFRVASIMLAAKHGGHVSRDDVEVLQVTSIEIDCNREVPFGADGDEVTELPTSIKLRPKSLRILVPN